MVLSIARGRVLGALANQDFIMRTNTSWWKLLTSMMWNRFIELGKEQVAAVRGNGDAIVKITIGFEDVTGFLGGEVVKADGMRGTSSTRRIRFQ